jgi:flagellar protein FlaG
MFLSWQIRFSGIDLLKRLSMPDFVVSIISPPCEFSFSFIYIGFFIKNLLETETFRSLTDISCKNFYGFRRREGLRITTQTQVKDIAVQPSQELVSETSKASVTENSLKQLMQTQQKENEEKVIPKEKVQKAVDAINEFMTIQNHNSKFVMHEGLDRYYVQVVDSDTDEVIREVPPRKLLDAFYTMQRFLGMIVDEKI